MEVYLHSQREHERKIQQLEQKLAQSREKNKKYSRQTKYLRKRVKELQRSRNNWKAKNRSKGQRIKALGKRGFRSEWVKRHHYPLWLIALCIRLRVQAGCSYRGICRVLSTLQCCFLLGATRLPCANTVENWVSKMGYYCLEEVRDFIGSEGACLIVDESIQQGNERVLLMLVTPWQHKQEGSLGYKDIRICYLGGKSSWTGEKIQEKVAEIVAQTGIVIKAVLSDEDSKLLKAARLLDQPHLPDINHALASCLRKTFERNETYQSLVRQVTSYQARSVNQSLSYLRPPKQRIKARFMNQKGFVKWGLTMLEKFEQLQEKEKAFFAQLPKHRPMLETLDCCIDLAEKTAKLLKTMGLSKETLAQVEQLLAGQKDSKGLIGQFLVHLENYVERYRTFIGQRNEAVNVSSDIIESLFGRHKHIKATNTLTGMSQLDLELPVYSIEDELITSVAKTALESTFTTHLKTWRATHSSDNQARRRKIFFENGT